jgi:hypothetical protein
VAQPCTCSSSSSSLLQGLWQVSLAHHQLHLQQQQQQQQQRSQQMLLLPSMLAASTFTAEQLQQQQQGQGRQVTASRCLTTMRSAG